MAGLLKPAQKHDLEQASDVQARRRCIETDIAGHDLLLRQRIEPLGVGSLVDVAALFEQLKH